MTVQPVFKARDATINNHKYYVMQKDLFVKTKLNQNVLITELSGTILCDYRCLTVIWLLI